jgi:hypothetical protein
MRPGVHNIVVDPRGSYREHYDVTGFDWTGYTEARAEVRDKPEGATLYISVSEVPSADGYILIDSIASTIDIFFSDTATARMAGRRSGAWDLFLENTNLEDRPKFIKGKVTVDPSVTDPTSD